MLLSDFAAAVQQPAFTALELAVFAEVGIEKASLCFLCAGTPFACHFAQRHPDRITGKVLGPAVVLCLSYLGYKVTRQQWMYELFLILSFVCSPAFCDSLFRFFDCKQYEDGVDYLGE